MRSLRFAFLFAVLIVCQSSVRAQVPVIDSMDIDESKSELLVHGSLGTEQGTVEVDGVPVTVLDWESDLVRCQLPETGKGSAGPVVIKNSFGATKPRLITLWHFNINRWRGLTSYPTYKSEHEGFRLHWRLDLHSRLLAKVGYTRLDFTPMHNSWHGDTILATSSTDRDTLFESSYSTPGIFWYLHNFQDGSGQFTGIQWQMPTCLFDSSFVIRSYHDTLKSSGVWIGETWTSGSVEFAPPPQAVWLGKTATHKYEVIDLYGHVQLQCWNLPWMEKYQLQVLKDNGTTPTEIVLDTIMYDTKPPFITVKITLPPGGYWWHVRGINSESEAIWSQLDPFSVEGPKSVGEKSEKHVRLLQNPANSVLRINLGNTNEGSITCALYDALGREVLRSTSQAANNIFEQQVSALATGVYTYHIEGRDMNRAGKVVIAR